MSPTTGRSPKKQTEYERGFEQGYLKAVMEAMGQVGNSEPPVVGWVTNAETTVRNDLIEDPSLYVVGKRAPQRPQARPSVTTHVSVSLDQAVYAMHETPGRVILIPVRP